MTPLPFSLPAVLSLDALRASRELTLVQIYDQYPTQAARAACVLSREVRPERPVVVLAELEADGLTADQWAPDALLALFEGVGASALILACPADPDRLSVVLRELVPYAAVPLGVCVPSGMEDERERPLRAVTSGQTFDVDSAIDIDAECDLDDEDIDFSRWLLDQEEDNWGAVRLRVSSPDDLALFDAHQYMLRVPVALAGDDPAVFEQALRRFCGIALYDGTSDFDAEFLERLQREIQRL